MGDTNNLADLFTKLVQVGLRTHIQASDIPGWHHLVVEEQIKVYRLLWPAGGGVAYFFVEWKDCRHIRADNEAQALEAIRTILSADLAVKMHQAKRLQGLVSKLEDMNVTR